MTNTCVLFLISRGSTPNLLVFFFVERLNKVYCKKKNLLDNINVLHEEI